MNVHVQTDDGKTKKYTFFTFVEVWQFMVYWVALWFAGKTTEAVRFPSLVGELIMGVLLGVFVNACVCVCLN